MNYIKLIVVASLLLITNQINAQLKENYEKGQIITKNGKKKSGYIRNDDFKHKISKVCFKTSLADKKCRPYDTSELILFQTENGEVYNLFVIKLDNDVTQATLFAKKILDGKAASLHKGYHNQNVFYIISKDDKNYILQNDQFISGQTEIKRFNYVGILNFATKNLPIRTNTKVEFKEQLFIEIIGNYNTEESSDFNIIETKEKPTNFLIVNAGIGLGNSNESEYFAQFTNRIYFPKFSRNTSLNIGLNYYNYQYTETDEIGRDTEVTQSLISAPFQLQYNFANKNIRPFIFSGMNFSYYSKKDKNGKSLLEDSGLQSEFGLSFLFGAGIEIDLYKGLMLKSEYRHETFTQLILIGIGYNFSK
jgi:opacity protein-like surface antigen